MNPALVLGVNQPLMVSEKELIVPILSLASSNALALEYLIPNSLSYLTDGLAEEVPKPSRKPPNVIVNVVERVSGI